MRQTGRASRLAGVVLRFCVAVLVILQIAYTPIHLVAEPHSDEVDYRAAAPVAVFGLFVGEEDHDGDGHHERHPAAQHKFKLTQPTRGPMAEMMLAPVTQCVEVARDCARTQEFAFSGLSPPELSRCWQFVYRAALPVRAPSLNS